MVKAANELVINEKALSYAVTGISDPGTMVIPYATTLYRLASTYTKEADQRPVPERYPTLQAYEVADKKWMFDNSSEEVWARLIKGSWWFTSADLMRFKYASMEDGVPLSNCGRQALAVASFWNNAEFMVEAKVKPTGGLKVFYGKGCTQTVEDPADSNIHKLLADPNVIQLYIPGLHVLENARAWLTLVHRHRLRRSS